MNQELSSCLQVLDRYLILVDALVKFNRLEREDQKIIKPYMEQLKVDCK